MRPDVGDGLAGDVDHDGRDPFNVGIGRFGFPVADPIAVDWTVPVKDWPMGSSPLLLDLTVIRKEKYLIDTPRRTMK